MFRRQYKNVFEAIRVSHDEGRFIPHGLPSEPTQAAPGSAEKMAVLMARIAAGVDLWHPLDRTCLKSRYEELFRQIEEPPYVRFGPENVDAICTDPWNEG